MSGIFISYRDDDSGSMAVLIDHALIERFGSDLVFLDSRSIPAGADAVDELLRQLRTCSVQLVVIGPRWLTLTDHAGKRRIDNPQDWVRREVALALSQGLRVIPVLLDNTTLPMARELPRNIAGLSRRQYVVLRRRHTSIDLANLAERIVQAEPDLAHVSHQGRHSHLRLSRSLF